MKSKTKITLNDLLKMENEGEGYGFLGHECRRPGFWTSSADPYAAAKLVDSTVVATANRKGFKREQLFEFLNSKQGRWMGDEIMMMKGDPISHQTVGDVEIRVEKYMNTFVSEKK